MATESTTTNSPVGVASNLWSGWVQQALSISQELSTFMMDRVSDDMTGWSQLAACKDPAEWLSCQQQLAQKSANAYLAEGQKIGRMMVSAAKS